MALAGILLLLWPVLSAWLAGASWVIINNVPVAGNLPVPGTMPPAGRTTPDPVEIRQASTRAIGFLKSQYNPALGLLRESPVIGYRNHYLTNDNALAVGVLELYGESDMAARLRASLGRYDYQGNGLVEVALGKSIPWPPNHHVDITVTMLGEDLILQETHPASAGYFYDWSAFSNLAFMGALNELRLGYPQSARRLYAIQMSTFDGLGWQDKAYWDRGGIYETIGLAWAALVGAEMGEFDPRVLEGLLRRQGPSGGFHTHFTAAEPRRADPNVETTCLALLAFRAMGR